MPRIYPKTIPAPSGIVFFSYLYQINSNPKLNDMKRKVISAVLLSLLIVGETAAARKLTAAHTV